MANKRIKDLTQTASTLASDDYVAIDGAANGTRKIVKGDLVNDISTQVAGTYLDEANNLSDVASKDTSKLNLEVPDVGTGPNEVPLNGMLGSLAYQSADSVAMGTAEVETLDVKSTTGTATTQALTVTDGTDTNFVVREDGQTIVGGTTSSVSKFGSTAKGLTVRAVTSPALALNDTDNADYVGYFAQNGNNTYLANYTAGNLYLGTNATTHWTIDSSGSLLASSNGTGSRAASQPIVFYGTNSGSVQIDQGSIGTEAGTANSNAGELVFKASNSSGALTERFRINEDGNIQMASGLGIDFGSGDTLSDYEEGVHTTTINPNVSGSISLYSSYDGLAYTKIGRSIIVTGQLQVSSVSSPVGTSVTLTLPTSTLNLGDFSGGFGAGAAYYNGSSWGPISCAAGESSNTLYLHVDASTVSADDQFRIMVCYQSA